MKLRYVLRNGQKFLQQSKKCSVLFTEKWEDVKTEVEEDSLNDPGFSHPPTGGLAMEHLERQAVWHEEDSLCPRNCPFSDFIHSHEKEAVGGTSGACSEDFGEPKTLSIINGVSAYVLTDSFGRGVLK